MAEHHPLISVIIPAYNRPGPLAACLQSLTRLDYPRDRFEVIVVDDGSSTPPADVISAVADQIDVRLVEQENAGPAAARNRGAGEAGGKFLCFLDDDCLAAPDWLKKLEARFDIDPHAAIGGKTIDAPPGNTYSTATQAILDAVYGYYASIGQASFFATANLAVPAGAFRSVGGFDERFLTSEDREFCDRWQLAGYRLVFAPEVLVYHVQLMTFRKFLRRHFGYGRGAWRFAQHRVDSQARRTRLDLRFYLYLFHYPLSAEWSLRGIRITTWVVFARLTYVAGYFWERLH
jgi:GT2 family glycosyltransferase